MGSGSRSLSTPIVLKVASVDVMPYTIVAGNHAKRLVCCLTFFLRQAFYDVVGTPLQDLRQETVLGGATSTTWVTTLKQLVLHRIKYGIKVIKLYSLYTHLLYVGIAEDVGLALTHLLAAGLENHQSCPSYPPPFLERSPPYAPMILIVLHPSIPVA
ncbi:hypothetical protein L6452_09224 [Arctium lappa]|uniref:Uncharacterized protein n=1 Tax=Arctium lappa TaxID=4217 RepID=A0ACB9DJD9_ARCLA|nr:hypothetical protein L6452_09224 [Arctium lappa]